MHTLDLSCAGQSNTAPFCKNYAKLYFDAKHLEKGLNRGGEIFGTLFSKKVLFFQKTKKKGFFGQYRTLP